MNIKKLFSVAAVVTFVGSTFLNGLALAATPDTELGKAYEWAYANGITTMGTYEAANMTAPITRAEMAKMLSNYAKKFQNKTPDTSKTCKFLDTTNIGGDLAVAIIESCQLGIMGVGIDNFRPNETITRAEFGTALSRVLWDETYGGETPYYAGHLRALQGQGIMKVIANAESTKEIRGYVMLMLMRASEGSEPAKADCEDPIIKAACLLESDECPAECKGDSKEDNTVVKSGSLVVKAVANKGANVIAGGAASELDTLTFKASEDITLKSITLERYGYSSATSVANIWLEDEDGNEITSKKTISTSKDTVTLSLKKDYQSIKDGDSVIVVISTPEDMGLDDLGKNIGFKVTGVESSAKDLDLSDYSANLYDIISYTGSDAKVQFKGSTKSYNYADGSFYEVAKLKVTATNAALLVNGFTLTQNEDMDLSKFVDEVEVSVEGKTLKSKSSVKRDEIKITLDEAQEIAINKNAQFTVKVSLKDFDDLGSKIELGLESSSDLNVLESKNKVRVSIKDFNEDTGLYGPVYTFNGGKITLTNVKLASSIDAAAGSSDVVIAQGNIKLGGQALRIKGLKIVPTINGSEHEYVKSLRLVIGDEEYEANEQTYKFDTIVIEDNADIKLLLDIDDLAEGDENANITIDFKVNDVSGALSSSTLKDVVTYDDIKDNDDNAAKDNLVGSVSISSVKVQPAKGSLTNDNSKKVEFKVGQTESDKVVFEGTYTAKKNTVNLDNAKIKLTGTKDKSATDDVSFKIEIDGDVVASIDNPTADGEDADFAPIEVEAGKSVKVRVLATVFADKETVDPDTDNSYTIQYKLFLSGKDDAGNDAGNSSKDLAPLSFVKSSSINVSTNASVKKQDVVLANKNQELARFIVKPANKANSAELDKLVFKYDNAVAGLLVDDEMTAEDYFEVQVGNDNDFTIDWDKNDKTLTVSDMSTDIEKETTVKLIFKEKLATAKATATSYEVTLDSVNDGESLGTSYVYKRTAVNSLVRVEKMEGNKQSETKYTLDIEFSDDANSETVPTLTFTYTSEIAGHDTDEPLNKSWENVQDGNKYNVDNGTGVNYVTDITWTDGDGYTVALNSTEDKDFFKTNGNDEDLLRAYKDSD